MKRRKIEKQKKKKRVQTTGGNVLRQDARTHTHTHACIKTLDVWTGRVEQKQHC